LTPRTFYCRAATIALVSAFLGACSSTTGGLDVIATDLPTRDSATSVAQSASAASSEAAKAGTTSSEVSTLKESASVVAQAAPKVAPAGQGSAEAEANARVAASAEVAAPNGEAAVAAVEAVAASAVPTQRPGIAGEPVEVPVNAFAAQKSAAPLATVALEPASTSQKVAANSPELHALISRYAAHYQVPESLVRRVVKRESNFDPSARNKIYWGLMQIRHDTARTMGYTGAPHGLLDAETNLKYAVKYLRGAYLTADGDEDQAVRFYSRGYYYDAKRKGLLKVTGLRP